MDNDLIEGPLFDFLRDTRGSLRGHLPAARLDAFLNEAKSKITERARVLVASGIEPREAEERAVASFNQGRLKTVVGSQSNKGPIAVLLNEAERRLRRSIPKEQLELVLDEAKGHLLDRADDIAESGLNQSEAEAKAVVLFGDVNEWANEIRHSVYSDPLTEKARLLATCSAGLMLAFPTLWSLGQRSSNIVWTVGMVGLALGAFRARQWKTSLIAYLGLAAAVLSFTCGSLNCISMIPGLVAFPRSIVSSPDMLANQPIRKLHSDIALLQLGLQTYPSYGSIGHVPQSLRVGTAYIVPRSKPIVNSVSDEMLSQSWYSAFTPPPANVRALSSETQAHLELETNYQTVPTAAAAAQAWRSTGSYWLSQETIMSNVEGPMDARLLQSLHHPSTLDLGAGMAGVTITAGVLAFVLALDRIAANIGRLAFRRFRRNGPLAG